MKGDGNFVADFNKLAAMLSFRTDKVHTKKSTHTQNEGISCHDQRYHSEDFLFHQLIHHVRSLPG